MGRRDFLEKDLCQIVTPLVGGAKPRQPHNSRTVRNRDVHIDLSQRERILSGTNSHTRNTLFFENKYDVLLGSTAGIIHIFQWMLYYFVVLSSNAT